MNDQAEPLLLSFAQYARHRGCAPSAVTQAVKEKRISVVMVDGKARIDPARADDEWARNTRARADVPREPLASGLAVDDGEPSTSQLYDMAAARAKREHHEANLADLKERRTAGLLVERGRVEKAAIDAGAHLRASLEQLPGKLGVQLAAESEPAAVRALLTAAVQEILADLTDNLRAMADGERRTDSAA